MQLGESLICKEELLIAFLRKRHALKEPVLEHAVPEGRVSTAKALRQDKAESTPRTGGTLVLLECRQVDNIAHNDGKVHRS